MNDTNNIDNGICTKFILEEIFKEQNIVVATCNDASMPRTVASINAESAAMLTGIRRHFRQQLDKNYLAIANKYAILQDELQNYEPKSRTYKRIKKFISKIESTMLQHENVLLEMDKVVSAKIKSKCNAA